jgi:gliding motility-associated-like protein
LKSLVKILSLFVFSLFIGHNSSAQLAGYIYYKPVTINSSLVQGLGDHIDFPIMISETDAQMAYSSFGGEMESANGWDIKFSLNDGLTELEHQLESYNPMTGAFTAWVKIPTLSTTVDTEIWMNYGNASILSDQSSDLTWDANYKGVYHLTDNFLDGTSSNADLTNAGTVDNTVGAAAKCRDFTSTNDNLSSLIDPDLHITGDLTISAWVDFQSYSAGSRNNTILGMGGSASTENRNFLYYFNILNDGRMQMDWEYGAVPAVESTVTTNTISMAAGFSMLTVTRDATANELFFYQDGSLIEGPISYVNDPTGGTLSFLRVGEDHELAATAELDGYEDEIRISNIARDADWLATTFNSINDPAFYSVGAQVASCDAAFSYGAATYCLVIDPDPVPTITGDLGGVFTASPLGVVINSSTGEINLQTSTSGVYTISYSVFPCIETFDVTINNADDASFNYSTTNYCETASNQLPTSVTSPGGSWSANSGLISIVPLTGEVDISGSTPGIYKVYYTTNGLCPVTDSVDFVIEPLQDATFDYDLSYCTPGTNVLPNNVATAGGTFSEVTTNLQIVNTTTGEINLNTTTPGNYTIDYLTPNLCATTSSFSIEILPPINDIFWIPDTVCLPDTFIDLSDSVQTILGETSSFYSYGGSGSATHSGSMNEILDYSTTAGGTYNVTHVVDNGTCEDSLTLQITLVEELNPTTQLLDTLCENIGTFDLNNLFISGTTSAGGFWEGTSIAAGSIIDLSGLSGDYTIDYITGYGQCHDTSTQIIHVLPDLDSSWTMPTPICIADGIVDFSLLVTGSSPGVWSGNGMTGNNFDPTVVGAGSTDITYTVGTPACDESLTHPITVIGIPTPDAGIDTVACGLDIQMFAYDSGVSGYWYSDPDFTTNDSSLYNADITVADYGLHEFVWHEQEGSCQNEDTLYITFYEQPTADAGDDIVLNYRFFTNLNAVETNVGAGNWTTLEGANIVEMGNPATSVNGLMEGTNVFTWTVYNGSCPTVKDDVIVTVNSIFIPAAISPNDDDKNDTFIIDGIEELPNSLNIMNRWGQSVFQTENYQNDWKGTDSSGETLMNDTYYYILIVDDTLTYKGYLVIKK